MPTTDELKTQLDLLTARVNSIDGIGLVSPATGSVPTLQRDVAGLRTTIKQTGLNMQQLYLDLKASVETYIALFKTKFGIA